MDVDAVVEDRHEAVDVTDGLTTSLLQNDNNNLPSTLITAKQNKIFLENNIPASSTVTPESTPTVTLNDSKRLVKTKSLAETIETLKQNASTPLANKLSSNSNDIPVSEAHTFNGKLDKFSQHRAFIQERNVQNVPHHSAPSSWSLPGDIICNRDGNVYIVPNHLSTKLLTHDGILNEPGDTRCTPFPVLAKRIRYFDWQSAAPRVMCYSVSPLQENEQNSSHISINICLPCRLCFSFFDNLLEHFKTIHGATGSISEPKSKTSAVIQQTHNQSASILYLRCDGSMTVENMLLTAETFNDSGSSNGGSRKSSTATTTAPLVTSSKAVSTTNRSNYCDEHPEGGIECPKCDTVLSSTRSLGGHMTMMHSRNSCKTLKCPKCNWHYKYQETLEIHMKEKHPETEHNCQYCLSKLAHPRLARGETYSCGYKPYRCEACNYSTTTKGNLSIHMQSDKHINNMQEFQNGSTTSTADSSPVSTNTSHSSMKAATLPQKKETGHSSSPSVPHSAVSLPSLNIASTQALSAAPVYSNSRQQQLKTARNTYRCDVCNYETTIARNLRIHMTSEKHSHNMVILQQNVRSMQRNVSMAIGSVGVASPGQADAAAYQRLGTMFPFDPLGIVGQIEVFSQQQGDGDAAGNALDEAISYHSPHSRDIYGCVICSVFTTDSLTELENHINADRSSASSADHVTITSMKNVTNYLCNLCDYKSTLKANFQLHCKTDKHVQRVQLINHIREGGADGDWRMKYLNMPNPVHIVCNVCSYQSNSIQKMSVHSMPPSHMIGASLFVYLRRGDESTVGYVYQCGVCTFTAMNRISMVTHVRTQHASQLEQLYNDGWKKFSVKSYLPESSEPKLIGEDKSERNVTQQNNISSVQAIADEHHHSQPVIHSCPQCHFTSTEETVLQEHITSTHGGSARLACPLCAEKLVNIDVLERHLFTAHNVNKDGAKKLLALIDTSDWKTSSEGNGEVKHTDGHGGYLCWKKGCNQYFNSDDLLQVHFREIHGTPAEPGSSGHRYSDIRAESVAHINQESKSHPPDEETGNQAKCFICNHVFRSMVAFQKHLEVTHSRTKMEATSAAGPSCSNTAVFGKVEDANTALDIEENGGSGNQAGGPMSSAQVDECGLFLDWHGMNTNALSTSSRNNRPSSMSVFKGETTRRDAKPFKCNVCELSYGTSDLLDHHLLGPEHMAAAALFTQRTNSRKSSTGGLALSELRDISAGAAASNYNSYGESYGETNDKQSSTTISLNLDTRVSSPSLVDTTEVAGSLASARHVVSSTTGEEHMHTPVHSDDLQMNICHHCNSKFALPEALVQHQKSGCVASTPQVKRTRTSRKNFKKLLNSFGIECVMGFLESEQQSKEKDQTSTGDNSSESETNQSDDDTEDIKAAEDVNMLDMMLPPEMGSGKLSCSDCGQTFSGIWVLKAHKEECHDQLLPEVITSHFAKLYKRQFEDQEEESRSESPSVQEVKNQEPEARVTSAPQVAAPPAEQTMKVEPVSQPSSTANSMPGVQINPMDLLNFPGMNPWLSMLPFGMMPPAMFNPLVAQSSVGNMAAKSQQVNSMTSPPLISSPKMETTAIMNRQHSISSSNQQQQLAGEKRARTRISDDQLKVLRQYFDINNSPSEESILEMASKTGLPAKVIKHWFRNTLFKERQRNKDSPYNFNNPPQTTLNLEEYEKTGRVPEKSSSKSESESIQADTVTISTPGDDVFSPTADSLPTPGSDTLQQPTAQSWPPSVKQELPEESQKESKQDMRSAENEYDKSTAAYSTTYYDADSDQEDDGNPITPTSPPTSLSSDNAISSSNSIFSKIFSNSPYKFHEYSNSSASKRANRTRFTDFQIKTLQDYFEQNAYPKDEELEQLSRVLQLPNRVIVVWFQNARQKARKVYENGPSAASSEVAAVSQPAKSTYPCKKCGVVFTGYYELVKHQKRVCMKNNIVPLPFGNQEGPGGSTSSAATKEKPSNIPSHHSMSESSTCDTISDITSKQANLAASQGLLTQMGPSSVPPRGLTDNMAAAAAAMDMANLMSSYGGAANLGSLFPHMMPLPGVLGTNPSVPPIQNLMKELYEQSLKKCLEGNQKLNAVHHSAVKNEPTTSTSASTALLPPKVSSTNGDHAVDLTRVLGSPPQQVINSTVEKSHPKLSATSSLGEDEGSVCDSDQGDEHESTTSDTRAKSVSSTHSMSGRSVHNKRYRTNLTNLQIHIMKYIFKEYKTPTMAECDILGNFIGLQKRVIQVWFQNARAKEKKSKLVNSSSNVDDDPLVTECRRCGVVYSAQCPIQEHIFSSIHINHLRSTFSGKLTDCDRDAMRKQAEVPRMAQSSRRVSNSISKKPDSLPKMAFPASSSNAGKAAPDYQSQLSKSLLSSLNPMGGMLGLPGADMLSLMYPSMLQQMPSFLPSLLPGGFGSTDQSMGLSSLYNSLEFGTPLSILQIPQAAIESIQRKISDTDCTVAEYSQDGSTIQDLYKCIPDDDLCIVKPTHAEVGYACRYCQFVYPRKEACDTHQSTVCYIGKRPSSDTTLKIEQLQFSCITCKENLPTIQEFRNHCITEAHKYKRIKFNNNNNDTDSPSAKRLRIV